MNIDKISLITENCFEVIGNANEIIQEKVKNGVRLNINLSKVYFSKSYMDKVTDVESILKFEEVCYIKYYFEDGSYELREIKNYAGSYSIYKTKTNILLNIVCDSSDLLNVNENIK